MLSPLATALRLASLLLCLIVIVSFALFVINQTSSASAHQQLKLNTGASTPASAPAPSGSRPAGGPAKGSPAKGSARETIDEASKAITSPFDAATDGISSQWLIRGTDLLIALVVYGFGLGFIARTIRVRL